MEKQDDNWLPLESNPEVMNSFIKELGFNTNRYSVQDVLSTEQWAQQMIGQPVLGIIFLFQINELQKQYEKTQSSQIKPVENVFFMKQYASNACGTIALFHTIFNTVYDFPEVINEESYLSKFRDESFGKSPQQIGQNFKKNKQICQKHKASVKKGSTKVTSKVDTHFIAFIQKDNYLYELDGRKKAPINHGQCLQHELTAKACEVIKKFMSRDPTNNKFTILALANDIQF